MRFCSECGSDALTVRIPDGDTLTRIVCGECATIHYQNPRVVVGTIPVWGDKVLLCKRAIEPRYGLWTLPAGFLENGETVEQGAMRETLEEANARVQLGELYAMISLVHVHQVYMIYRAELSDLDFGPGTESLEVRLFDESEIPWESLAFKTITRSLRCWFFDRKAGSFRFRSSFIDRPSRATIGSVASVGVRLGVRLGA